MINFDKETAQKMVRKLHNKGIEQTPEQFIEGINHCAENIGRFLYFIGFNVSSTNETFLLVRRMLQYNIITDEAIHMWNEFGQILKDHRDEIETMANSKIDEWYPIKEEENEYQ